MDEILMGRLLSTSQGDEELKLGLKRAREVCH